MKKTSDGGEAMEPLKPLNKGWSEHFKVHLMSSVIFFAINCPTPPVVPPHKVLGPSWHPPQRPSQQVRLEA